MNEKTIIGSAIVDKECRKLVLTALKEDFFTNIKLRRIYNILNEFTDKEEIDSFLIHLKTNINIKEIEEIKEHILTSSNLILLIEKEIDRKKKKARLNEITKELKNDK